MTSTIKINKCYQRTLKKCFVLHIGVFLCMYKPGITAGPKCGRPGRTVKSSNFPSGDTFNEGDVIRYKCNEEDHVILGPFERKCQSNGLWSDDIPVCSKLAQFEHVFQAFQESEMEKRNSIDGNISTCSEAPKGNHTIWKGRLPILTNISAVQVTIVGMGEIDVDVILQVDDTSTVKKCRIKNENSDVVVKSTVTLTFYCPANSVGKFVNVIRNNQALRICEVSVLLPPESGCLSPDIPLHGNGYRKVNATESLYIFTCKNGYKRWGELMVACTPDGRWSPKSPICGEIYCFTPDEIENGNMEYRSNKNTIPYNGIVKFTCDKGFYLDGPSTITCSRWNEWDSQPPVCKPIPTSTVTLEDIPITETWRQPNVTHCGNLPHIANGALVVNSSSVGSTAWLKCSEGFKPLTLDHVSCLPTGKWSSQSLLCTIIQCDANPAIPYGKAVLLNNSSYYGAYLEIKCNEGYTSHSPITRKCNEFGTWGNLDICVDITCGTIDEDTQNKWQPVNGSTYIRVLICPEDFHIEGSPAVIRCLSNGSWSYSSAKCTKSFTNLWGSDWTPSFILIAAIGVGVGTAILILCLSIAFLVIKKRRQTQTNTTVFHLENVLQKDEMEQSNIHRRSHPSEVENYKNEVEYWSQSISTNPRKSQSALPNLPIDTDPVYAQPFETAAAEKKTSAVTLNKKDDLYNNHIYAEPVDSRKHASTHTPITPLQIGNDRRLTAVKTNFIYESPSSVQTDQQNCDKKCVIYDSSSNSTLNSGQLASDEKYQGYNENASFDSLRYNLEYLELI